MERNLNLKAEIVRSGKTQNEIAELMGIPPTTLSLIVVGRMVPYDHEKEALARILNKSIAVLFD